jgi:peptidoglycan/xylan/chitin deacetylase (PgdA/CDA1 family)
LATRQDSRALALAVAGASLYLAPALTAHVARTRGLLGVRDRVPDPDGVALTFDDGPHPEGTPAVLELLREAGARATFFLAGEQVACRPELAAEVAAAGHAIGVHCQRHRNLLRLTPWQVTDDLRRAEEIIASATGQTPRLYRPPYGVLNAAALAFARRRGWTPLLWTRWGRDWEPHATPASIAWRLLRGLGAGDVLLLHDADYYSADGSWRRTARSLPVVLEALESRGLRAVAA